MKDATINQRAQQILKILVERYIQDGNPIASKTLAENKNVSLSSATIRHILADLEEAGYLTSPHTSAGRIPTALGYRMFVNSLLTSEAMSERHIAELNQSLNPDLEIPQLVQSASALLSGLTKMVAVVSLPHRNTLKLRQVEFLPLSHNRVLVILVLNNRDVQNRVIYTDKTYSAHELMKAANYLNQHFEGTDLTDVRQKLLQSMKSDKATMTNLLETAIDVADKAFVAEDKQQDYVVTGQNNLFNFSKKEERENFYTLFEAFSQKQIILNLLNDSLKAEGIQIFIGKESGYDMLDDCSLVTATYAVDNQLIGSLGVIGPTRMPYDKVIHAVDITSKLLSAALNHQLL